MNYTDVLKAERICVDQRIYRLLSVRESLRIIDDDEIRSNIHFDDDDDFDHDLPIMHQGDRFFITIHVPISLIGYIVGQNRKNKLALEKQYHVTITVPPKKNAEAGITIYGSTKKDVSLTYSRIQEKVNIARLKTASTHFASFPVNSASMQESFLKFKEEILAKYKGMRGIHTSIFQKPSKLHVTVAVLVLLDERDKENAIAILSKSKESILKDLGEKEITVRVKGLEHMNDDPANVDVLYAQLQELDEDNRLQILADKIMNEFVNENLSRTQNEKVKLHITLMNTLFREQLESNENNDSNRISFDARPILENYKDYDFGEMILSEIHISIRYTEASDGYFNSIIKMKLNS